MQTIFGERLQLAMTARGVNSRWVADEIETSPSNISRYCTGRSHPEILDFMAAMAKALNVSADYLLGLTDKMLPQPALAEEEGEFESQYSHLIGTPEFRIYVGVYNNLPPKSRAFLAEFVKAYGINQNVLQEDGATLNPNQYS